MSQTKIQTIQCPRCNNQLPGWAQQCQFCGAAITNVQRPVGVKTTGGWDGRMSWQEIAYIIVSILIILLGVLDVARGLGVIPDVEANAVYWIFGGIQIVMGAGLVAQQTWAQFVMKWFCVLRIVFGGWGLLMGLIFASTKLFQGIGLLMVVASFFEVAVAGFMLYLLSVVGDVDY